MRYKVTGTYRTVEKYFEVEVEASDASDAEIRVESWDRSDIEKANVLPTENIELVDVEIDIDEVQEVPE